MVVEANKEEAIRAVDIAVKKMENKDFSGAFKIALKAQKLFPEMENISQLISVCDVHCSAENKVCGSEKNWYNILKIETNADEGTIKKQYRKLALLLHPDKNKFTGATDAFKLIGEAQRVLLDPAKRSLFDSKFRIDGISRLINRTMPQASRQSNDGRQQPWLHPDHVNVPSQSVNQQPQHSKQSQRGSSNAQSTFWTICPFCAVSYQYYKNALNTILKCQYCKKSFTGCEMNAPSTKPGADPAQPAFPEKKANMTQNCSRVGPQSKSVNHTSSTTFQSNVSSQNQAKVTFAEPDASLFGEGSKPNGKCRTNDVKNSKRSSGETRDTGKKRKSKTTEERSYDTGSSSDCEEVFVVKKDGKSFAGKNMGSQRYPRRSTRSKPNISYSDNLSDNDEARGIPEHSKHGGSSPVNGAGVPSADMEEDEKETVGKEDSSRKDNFQNGVKEPTSEFPSESSSDTEVEPMIYEYPDPDFSDFDKDRREECFKDGQLWAIYDNSDAMPRYYALIRKVFSTGFKLRITWLEPDPVDEDEIKWVDEDLPTSCGLFRYGETEIAEDHPMFSHLVSPGKGSKRGTYKIYPKKGETWAIFKNWDIKWYSDPKTKKKFEFDFVEVLSDYDSDAGVSVAYLTKMRGFSCIYNRTEGKDDLVRIPPKDILRFSHRIPSFRMTGKEREDVPEGSFELDPASLPTNHEKINVPNL